MTRIHFEETSSEYENFIELCRVPIRNRPGWYSVDIFHNAERQTTVAIHGVTEDVKHPESLIAALRLARENRVDDIFVTTLDTLSAGKEWRPRRDSNTQHPA